MTGFVKLDGGIVDSSVWMQPDDVLRVWIALLAKCDGYGLVRASIPAMAHLCRTTPERFQHILLILTSPDPYSRTADDDGRRLRQIEGGWLIVNYVKYRELVQTKPHIHAERQRKYRKRLKERDDRVTGDASPVTRDAEGEGEGEVEASSLRSEASSSGDDVTNTAIAELTSLEGRKAERLKQVTQEAIDAFNGILGSPNGLLPRIKGNIGREKRQKQVARCLRLARQICEEEYQSKQITSQFWTTYFGLCAADAFMSGRQAPGAGHETWKPSFEYLTREEVMLRIYDRTSEAAA